ncbi:MAG: rhomboid family intramembrane serine protease, partial [Bdellovibrionota bacterium]
ALKSAGFQILHVGKEPYVQLDDCIPSGKSGRGVRTARNQAVRAGVRVEEWTEAQIHSHPTMERDMRRILRQWKARNLVDLGGFVNAVEPFLHMKLRRYFLAFTEKHGLEAFLVATPIPGQQSFFLEDLVIRPESTRGTGELITLEAMIALGESKAKLASLGVVSLTSIQEDSAFNLPAFARWFLVTVPKHLSKIYNVGGLEMFRKRFRPQHWEDIYLALENNPASGVSDSRAWFKALYALIRSFGPKLNLSFQWIWHSIKWPLERNPVSYATLALTSLVFWTVNRGGTLPTWALDRFGFSGGAPISQWLWRTFTSDILYFDFTHYFFSTIAAVGLLRWMEKTHKIKFVVLFTLSVSFLDDIINYVVLTHPYSYFQPHIFARLIANKDVGTSLWIAAMLGLQLCNFKKNREILFAFLSLGTVLCFAFASAHLSNLVMNLNHFVFLTLGFIVGKVRFNHERAVSQSFSRKKAPLSATNPKSGISKGSMIHNSAQKKLNPPEETQS